MTADVSNIIVIVFGLPGSGKSYFAEKLAEEIYADYVNSDRLRKEISPARTYSESEKETVYKAMLNKMNEAFTQNKSLVLDATFHKKNVRERFIKNARGNIHFIEVWADDSVIKERLKKERPFSEADYKVHQLIRQQWEHKEDGHLRLESTNDNIKLMLQTALKYLKK